MTKLEFVNKFFFQLLFVRLTKVIETKDEYEPLHENSELQQNDDGYFWPIANINEVTYQWYSIMYFVIPFIGWRSNFRFITKMHLKRIIKKSQAN